ncbi:hypothetical protein PPTG_21457 [Phytophthora nicotianae INRA-310]|uniref:Reverse transcriptase domain-containing protein n=1 Tax=Phytophthora nicotianae (strain INRA-310) TaxID=761204 RepID=W2R1Y8_PHYN3|nr:hypothetical protein PPTG_21457 [Phytophthora nicotianae INRA-310]ETN19452.1 hypothetical protein PPTG_21457 [Phytophthora nicotianae INRA-310]
MQLQKMRTTHDYRAVNVLLESLSANTRLRVLTATQFETKVKAHEYVKFYHGTVKTSPKVTTVPPELQVVLRDFADVFPSELPSRLLPHRSIEHEVVSDSPWVRNIFGGPNYVTGKFSSRLEWLHSNNPHMPICWVIDSRLINAVSDVGKIPPPLFVERCGRMEGAKVFSTLDLASGYHQIWMALTSKRHWRGCSQGACDCGLAGTRSRFDVVTDNSACNWILQHSRVSSRLSRRLNFFATFYFKLHHRPGPLGYQRQT